MGSTSYSLVRILSLAPNKVADPRQTMKLTRNDLAFLTGQGGGQAGYRHATAVAYYRADQFAQTVGQSEQSMSRDPTWGGHVLTWLLLARAHQQMGHGQQEPVQNMSAPGGIA